MTQRRDARADVPLEGVSGAPCLPDQCFPNPQVEGHLAHERCLIGVVCWDGCGFAGGWSEQPLLDPQCMLHESPSQKLVRSVQIAFKKKRKTNSTQILCCRRDCCAQHLTASRRTFGTCALRPSRVAIILSSPCPWCAFSAANTKTNRRMSSGGGAIATCRGGGGVAPQGPTRRDAFVSCPRSSSHAP